MHRGRSVDVPALIVLLGIALAACGEPDTPFEITVTPAAVTFSALGDTKQLSAKVVNEKGKELTGALVSWSSDKTNVATVDDGGTVTAVGNGSATITASAGEVSGSATVTVAQAIATTEAVSGFGQTGTVAQALPAALVVRARDSRGNGVAGAVVTFTVSTDGGTVSPTSGTTGTDGQASTTWTFGTKAGSHQVTASISGSGSPVIFGAKANPGPAFVLSKVSGDNQFGYKGTRLAQPLAVRVRDQYANGVPNHVVTFAVDAGMLDSATAFTDTAGIARTTWVMPNGLDTAAATASAQIPGGGSLLGSPTTFAAISHDLNVASVSPSLLVEGQAAVLMGEGFDPNPSGNVVQVGDLVATVTAATPTRLDILVPTADCRPARSASLTVMARGYPSAPVTATVNPASFVTLPVGEQLIVRDPSQFCFQFAKTAAAETYLIGVQSASETVTELTGITLAGAAAAPAAAPRAAGPAPTGTPVAPVDLPRLRRLQRHRAAELAQREADRAVFDARPPALAPRAPGAGSAIVDSLKNVGDTVMVRISTGGCANYADLKTVVRAKGQKGLFLHDAASPSGSFDTTHFRQLSQNFDAQYYPNDAAYFGAPPDADGNGRVVMVFTPQVNQRNALGLTVACDLFPRSSHPASNEGEFFYLAVPDPSDSFFVADAMPLMPSALTHELVHVIQFTGRQASGGPFPSTWIAEGQAVLGEEVMGHAVENRQPGNNYGLRIAINLDDTSSTDWYSQGIVVGLGLYFGWDPVTSPGNFDKRVAEAPHECSWLEGKPANPGPCVGGLDAYGASWALLRWLSDRFYTPSTESGFHKAIISGTQNGYGLIQSLVGVPMDSLLAQFAAMLYVDDRDDMAGPAAAVLRMSSWDLYNIFYETDPQTGIRIRTALRLAPAAFTYGTFTRNARVRAASTFYSVLSGSNREATAVKARTDTGGTLPPWMRYWIVRLQ
jgi:hypothetical protein